MTMDPADGSCLTNAERTLIDKALEQARDTKVLAVDFGIRHRVAPYFQASFEGAKAIVVADRNTFQQAGQHVLHSLQNAGIECDEPFLFPDDVYGEFSFVSMLEERLATTTAIPVAVGSGSINDIVKLASHRQGRQYLTVATAASMDGYTAYGASITHVGSKQTFDCPAPLVVLADMEIIQQAPLHMNASGYADLLAKGAAGADWVLADALGEEAIDPIAWPTVQASLPSWVDSPEAIQRADPEYLRRLTIGLMMGGFAMQAARSSRPASGAEHQFSHLWDMQHHTYQGSAPSHGFKVGIGTCASLNLYRYILEQDLSKLDIERAAQKWPTLAQFEERIEASLGKDRELADKGLEETRAKYRDRDAIVAQLTLVKAIWPQLQADLEKQIRPFADTREMLRKAGSPFEPEQIGITRKRLRDSFEQAFYIRRRFTILDFAMRLGIFDEAVDSLFAPGAVWDLAGGDSKE